MQPPPLPPKGRVTHHVRQHSLFILAFFQCFWLLIIYQDFQDRQEPRELTDIDFMGSSEVLFITESMPIPASLSRKTSEFHPPGPKIAFSYQHDPKLTPMRKISTTSNPVFFINTSLLISSFWRRISPFLVAMSFGTWSVSS